MNNNLFDLAKNDDYVVFKTLIEQGYDVDQTDEDHNSLLMIAILNRSIQVVKILLDRPNLDMNVTNNQGQDVVDIIMNSQEEYHLENELVDSKLMIIAITSKNIKLIKYLLTYRHELIYGSNLLHIASTFRDTDIFEMLINHGANVNEQDPDGDTPLHMACLRGRKDLIRMLITHGADSSLVNYNGHPPWYYAPYDDYKEYCEECCKRCYVLTKGVRL